MEKRGEEMGPFSLRYRRQSSRVSCEMSSSVSWSRGLSSGDRKIVSAGSIESDSGEKSTGAPLLSLSLSGLYSLEAV